MDNSLRSLERGHTTQDRASFLQTKLRSGELSYSKLELIAYCGDIAAQALLTRCPPWCEKATHIGIGTPDCPKRPHHHFDRVCRTVPHGDWLDRWLSDLGRFLGARGKAEEAIDWHLQPTAMKLGLVVPYGIGKYGECVGAYAESVINSHTATEEELLGVVKRFLIKWALSPDDLLSD